MDWRPINTAPLYTRILLFDRVVHLGSVGHDGAGLVDGGNVQLGDIKFWPTHWQPLPEPPSKIEALKGN
jgi:hypothetical protein